MSAPPIQRRHTLDSIHQQQSDDPLRPGHLGPSGYKVHKHHRRTSSTGGGRAWTEEEEAYLLRTRQHKMPYKHIAAHLKKTELACRLHYHQMSYSSNRRKRNDSISSTSSFTSIVGVRECSPERTPYTRLSPVPSPPPSPECSPVNAPSRDTDTLQLHGSHMPILPKPETSGFPSLQQTPDRLFKPLCLGTAFTLVQSHSHRLKPIHIDLERLRKVYEMNRSSFWSLVAAEYSSDSTMTGAQLEEAFLLSYTPATQQLARSPPTPRLSPEGSSPRPYDEAFNTPASQSDIRTDGGNTSTSAASTEPMSSVPSSTGRCSVSALLTEEKEIRPFRKCV